MMEFNDQELVRILTNIAWSTMVLSHKNRDNAKNQDYDVTWNVFADFVNKISENTEVYEVTYDLMC